jgi:hypothetical protein
MNYLIPLFAFVTLLQVGARHSCRKKLFRIGGAQFGAAISKSENCEMGDVLR